jgi:hypothetical protein
MSTPNRMLCNLVFGKDGNTEPHQSGAWSAAEDGHTWALSPSAALAIPVAHSADDVVVVLDTWPATAPDCPLRTMVLQREGRSLAQLTQETRGVFCFPIGAVRAGSEVRLSFLFDAPVGGPGSDPRPLAFAFRSLRLVARREPAPVKTSTKPPLFALDADERAAMQIAGMRLGEPLSDAVTRFESLGHTCDLGFLQRQCGAEPLGLLRFGGIPTHGLVEGLFDNFAKLGRPGSLRPMIEPDRKDEYVMLDILYGLSWHTALDPGQVAPEQVLARETWRLPFLKRVFLETLAAGDKIFVLRPPRFMEFAEAEAVVTALRLHSDCSLLWAVQEQGEPGSVDIIRPYFFRGHLDVNGRRGNASMQAWLSLCANVLSAAS